jgi:hypothetical protein
MSVVRHRAIALVAIAVLLFPAGSRASSLGPEMILHALIATIIIVSLQDLGPGHQTKFGPHSVSDFDETAGPEVVLAPGTHEFAPPGETAPPPPSKPNGASVTPILRYQFGTPYGSVPNDRLTFDVSGVVSAVTAADELGNPLSLYADFVGELRFSIDTALFPADAVAGALAADALRALLPSAGETLLRLSVFEDDELAPPILAMESTATGGVAAASANLRAGHDYVVRLEYGAGAPYGVDPPFELDYGLTLMAVPEPGALALLCAGLASLGLVRRLSA